MKLPGYVTKALQDFPNSFINANNEIILEPKNNIYFRLDDVNSEIDFMCKMLAWVSRPIAKSLNKYWAPKVLESFNYYMGSCFTKEEMNIVYDRLGNDINRALTLEFISSGYALNLLKREGEEPKDV